MQDFSHLDPEYIMRSLETSGFEPTGEYQQLNSYENRVFDVRLENKKSVVVKFYRPERWSKKAILDEHSFLTELIEEGLDAVAPLVQKNGQTLSQADSLWMAVFPKHYGRIPQEFLAGDLQQIGRALALLHRVGAQRRFDHRVNMTVESYGDPALSVLEAWVAPELSDRYFRAAENILEFLTTYLDPRDFIRIHGDCHKGNLLSTDKGFSFVDFDDCCNGPRAQDIWMLTQGSPEESEELRAELLAGYEQLAPWRDDEDSILFEPLRGLRIIHYGAWIARRWTDPSFPRLFPDFNSYTYWAEETEALERIAWGLPS